MTPSSRILYVVAFVAISFQTVYAENMLFTADEQVAKTFPAGTTQIMVQMFNGSIELKTHSEKSINVEVIKRGSGASQAEATADIKNIEVTMTRVGKTLEIKARRADGRMDKSNSGALAKLFVPNGLKVDLRTSNDKITSEGPVGAVVARTSNGEITVQAAKGALTCQTSNEAITIDGGAGPLNVETSNAGIVIHADQVLVAAKTSNGPIRYTGKLLPGDHRFETSSDDVVLEIPGNTSFVVDAETSNGEISSAFSVAGADESEETVLRGTVGSKPKVSLNIRTSNANIELKRQ